MRVEIEKVEFISLISGNVCYYCDGPLNARGAGLDRLDGHFGYTVDNVVPCCSNCNNLKGTQLTPEETKAVIKTLKKKRKLKKNVWKHANNKRGLGYGISRNTKK